MHTHSMYFFLQNYVRWFDNIHIKISYFYPNTYGCCDSCIVFSPNFININLKRSLQYQSLYLLFPRQIK